MEPRKVILTLEVQTDAPLPVLRNRNAYRSMDVGLGTPYEVDILQVQANVIDAKKPGGLGKM